MEVCFTGSISQTNSYQATSMDTFAATNILLTPCQKQHNAKKTTWRHKFTSCESSSCLYILYTNDRLNHKPTKTCLLQTTNSPSQACTKKNLTILFQSRNNSTSCQTLHHYLPFSILERKSTFLSRHDIACMFKQRNRPSSQLHIHVQIQWNHQHSFIHTYHSHICIPFFNFLSTTTISTISSIICTCTYKAEMNLIFL